MVALRPTWAGLLLRRLSERTDAQVVLEWLAYAVERPKLLCASESEKPPVSNHVSAACGIENCETYSAASGTVTDSDGDAVTNSVAAERDYDCVPAVSNLLSESSAIGGCERSADWTRLTSCRHGDAVTGYGDADATDQLTLFVSD